MGPPSKTVERADVEPAEREEREGCADEHQVSHALEESIGRATDGPAVSCGERAQPVWATLQNEGSAGVDNCSLAISRRQEPRGARPTHWPGICSANDQVERDPESMTFARREDLMNQGQQGKILVMRLARRNSPGDARPDASRSERKARFVLIASIAGALGLYWGGAALSRHDETAGLRSLPAGERQSLYARTLGELSTICRDAAAAGGELRDHCAAQARFVLDLPECGDACQRAAAALLPRARR
jgi:hypothetical protein